MTEISEEKYHEFTVHFQLINFFVKIFNIIYVNCPNWQKKVLLSQIEKLGFGN